MSFGTSPGAGRPGSPPFRTDEADKKPTLIRERHVPRPTHAPPPRIIKYSRIRERKCWSPTRFPVEYRFRAILPLRASARIVNEPILMVHHLLCRVHPTYYFASFANNLAKREKVSVKHSLFLRYREDSWMNIGLYSLRNFSNNSCIRFFRKK